MHPCLDRGGSEGEVWDWRGGGQQSIGRGGRGEAEARHIPPALIIFSWYGMVDSIVYMVLEGRRQRFCVPVKSAELEEFVIWQMITKSYTLL